MKYCIFKYKYKYKYKLLYIYICMHACMHACMYIEIGFIWWFLVSVHWAPCGLLVSVSIADASNKQKLGQLSLQVLMDT